MAESTWRARLVGALKVWAVAMALLVAHLLVAGAAALYWSEHRATFRICAQGADPAQVQAYADAALAGQDVREVRLTRSDMPHRYCTTGEYALAFSTDGGTRARRRLHERVEQGDAGIQVSLSGHTTSLRSATGTMIGLAAAALGALAFWWWTRRRMPPMATVGPGRTVMLSLAAFVAAALAVLGYGGLLHALDALPGAAPGLDLPPGSGLVIVAIAVLVAPIIEEVVFRYWLLGRWAPLIGSAAALLLSSAIFAAIHMDFGAWALGGRLIVGLALGVLWLRTRSLWACIAVHAGWNAVVLLLARAAG